jgi:hypothetical protein
MIEAQSGATPPHDPHSCKLPLASGRRFSFRLRRRRGDLILARAKGRRLPWVLFLAATSPAQKTLVCRSYPARIAKPAIPIRILGWGLHSHKLGRRLVSRRVDSHMPRGKAGSRKGHPGRGGRQSGFGKSSSIFRSRICLR